MPAVKTHTEELRAALIDEAGRVLGKEGPAAVTLRRLALATGTSTTAVYTLFGDKAGLIEQMYIEGFRRLTSTVTASPATADPVQDLLAIACAYRRAALSSRYLYQLMFGRPVPGFEPSPRALAVGGRAYQPVVIAVIRCVELGAFPSDTDPEVAAYHLWAVAHGLVSLEIHRVLPLKRAEFDKRYAAAVSATISSYLAPGPAIDRHHEAAPRAAHREDRGRRGPPQGREAKRPKP